MDFQVEPSYPPRRWKLTQSKLLKVKKLRIAKTYNKNTTTPRVYSRVIEAKDKMS
jgi:hypothetical protein